MNLIEICVNCPGTEIARRIAAALIEQRLVACANVHSPIESRYRWKGNVEQEAEVPLVVKTREELFGRVAEAIKTMHPYETPSIIGTAASQVDPAYLDWIYAETKEPID